MSKKRKAVKTIGGILFLGGIFVLIGTAGSSDMERISLIEIAVNTVIGIALLGVGYFVSKLATGGGVYND